MMHFRRLTPRVIAKKQPGVHEPFYDRQYNLKALYGHPDHRDGYSAFIEGKWRFSGEREDEVDSTRAAFAADFAASVITGLVMAGYTEFPFFISKQLESCRNKILNLGFEELTPLQTIAELQKRDADIVILVPGCQDDFLLNRRVEALCNFIISLTSAVRQFTVILSGQCPRKGESVQIPNEANRMANMFRLRLAQRKPDLEAVADIIPISGEAYSSDTNENVENFFNHEAFRHSSNPVKLIAITSTFHLIRLWKALDRYTHKEDAADGTEVVKPLVHQLDKGGKPVIGEDGKRVLIPGNRVIQDFFLVGAEDGPPEKGFVTVHKDYIKLMMFDLYAHFLEEQPNLKKKDPTN